MTSPHGSRPAAEKDLAADGLTAGGRSRLGLVARAAAWWDGLSGHVDRVSVFLAAALGAAMAVALALQVLFRFVLHSPLSWSEEFARYCFVWVSSLGAAAGVRRGLHPGLDLVPGGGPFLTRRVIASVGVAGSVVFVAVLAYYGWRLAAFNMRQMSPAMGLPMGVPYSAVPVGAAVMLIHLVAKLLEPYAGQRDKR